MSQVNKAVDVTAERTKSAQGILINRTGAKVYGVYSVLGEEANLTLRITDTIEGKTALPWIVDLTAWKKSLPAQSTNSEWVPKEGAVSANCGGYSGTCQFHWCKEGLKVLSLPLGSYTGAVDVVASLKFIRQARPESAPKPKQGLLFPDNYESIKDFEADLAQNGWEPERFQTPVKSHGLFAQNSPAQETTTTFVTKGPGTTLNIPQGFSIDLDDSTKPTGQSQQVWVFPNAQQPAPRAKPSLEKVIELARKKAPVLPLRTDVTKELATGSRSTKQAAVYAIFGVFAEHYAVWVPVAGIAEILFEAGITRSKDPRSLGDFLGLGKGGMNLEKTKLGNAIYVKNPLLG